MSVTTHYDDDVGEFCTIFFSVCFVTRQYLRTTQHKMLEKTNHDSLYECITTERKGDGGGKDTASAEIQRTEKMW